MPKRNRKSVGSDTPVARSRRPVTSVATRPGGGPRRRSVPHRRGSGARGTGPSVRHTRRLTSATTHQPGQYQQYAVLFDAPGHRDSRPRCLKTDPRLTYGAVNDCQHSLQQTAQKSILTHASYRQRRADSGSVLKHDR